MQHRARCRWPSSGHTNKTVTAPARAPQRRQEAPGDTPGRPRVQRLQPGGLDPISSPRKLPLLLRLKTDLITDQRREDTSTRHASTQHFNDGPSRQGHRGDLPHGLSSCRPSGRPVQTPSNAQKVTRGNCAQGPLLVPSGQESLTRQHTQQRGVRSPRRLGWSPGGPRPSGPSLPLCSAGGLNVSQQMRENGGPHVPLVKPAARCPLPEAPEVPLSILPRARRGGGRGRP